MNFNILFINLLITSKLLGVKSFSQHSSGENRKEFVKKFKPHLKTKIASSIAKTERRDKERSHRVHRELCSNCQRVPVLCVCPSLPSELLDVSTHILVLQHPREFRRKSLSTVPLLPLILKKFTIKVGYNFEPNQLQIVNDFLEKGRKPLLLFPGNDAVSLDGSNVSNDSDVDKSNIAKKINSERLEKLKSESQLLIVLDGTWAEAKRMLMQSPNLVSKCQQVQFTAEQKSIYDVVRPEPEKHCISTLEACAHALLLLEPDESKERAQYVKEQLESSMKYMVQTKIRINEEKEPDPRFVTHGMKIYEKNKRRFEIKRDLFGS